MRLHDRAAWGADPGERLARIKDSDRAGGFLEASFHSCGKRFSSLSTALTARQQIAE